MNILNEFDDDVTEIDIHYQNVSGDLDFSRFTKLIKLNCGNNKITSINNLSNSLIELNCIYNQITSLDNLPNSLTKFYCDNTVKNYNELMEKYNNSLKN